MRLIRLLPRSPCLPVCVPSEGGAGVAHGAHQRRAAHPRALSRRCLPGRCVEGGRDEVGGKEERRWEGGKGGATGNERSGLDWRGPIPGLDLSAPTPALGHPVEYTNVDTPQPVPCSSTCPPLLPVSLPPRPQPSAGPSSGVNQRGRPSALALLINMPPPPLHPFPPPPLLLPGPNPALGHPVEYINVDAPQPAVCKYCGLRFLQEHHH
ncbi:unnamed protein product [Closterium sp. Naga37s-1]|nr:unnamed protein product [Closterium sp. Naga37s-1]